MIEVNNMYNVLLFGTGSSSLMVERILNNETNVVAYIDNDRSKWNSTKNGIPVYSLDQIKMLNYD